MDFSTFSRHSLASKYSPMHPVVKHPPHIQTHAYVNTCILLRTLQGTGLTRATSLRMERGAAAGMNLLRVLTQGVLCMSSKWVSGSALYGH